MLHGGVVGFGADGIDFAAHLLGEEGELFAGGLVGVVDCFLEVGQVGGQAHFLLGNIQLLNVVQHFLLEASGVELLVAGKLGEVGGEALAHVRDAGRVVGIDGGQLLADGGHVAQNLGAERLALIVAKLLDGGNGVVQQRLQFGPGHFLGGVGRLRLGGGGDDAGQAQGGQQGFLAGGKAQAGGYGLQLVEGGQQRFFVQGGGGAGCGRAREVDGEVYFAAQQAFGQRVANFQLVRLQEARQAQAEVKRLGINGF